MSLRIYVRDGKIVREEQSGTLTVVQAGVLIHTSDASGRGSRTGNVELQSDVGALEVAAKLSPSIRPGQVILYNGFEPYQHPKWLGQADIEPGMVKWLHLAGGYGHLKYRPWHWQPVSTDRGVRVDIRPASAAIRSLD